MSLVCSCSVLVVWINEKAMISCGLLQQAAGGAQEMHLLLCFAMSCRACLLWRHISNSLGLLWQSVGLPGNVRLQCVSATAFDQAVGLSAIFTGRCAVQLMIVAGCFWVSL